MKAVLNSQRESVFFANQVLVQGPPRDLSDVNFRALTGGYTLCMVQVLIG